MNTCGYDVNLNVADAQRLNIRAEVQRFSRERTGRLKYSTSCPWSSECPSEASRAMPTRRGPWGCMRGKSADMGGAELRLVFAYE